MLAIRHIIGGVTANIWRRVKRAAKAGHIDDEVLYQTFIHVFNAMVRYKAKQIMEILADADAISEFDVELYLALVEKVTVYDDRIVVSLLDGTNLDVLVIISNP
jgi:hypothetical protein